MNALTEYVIALADLLEAEARAMRHAVARLAGALAIIAVAAVLTIGGLALWLWSLYLYVTRYLPADAAALATGLATLLSAGILLWLAKRMNR